MCLSVGWILFSRVSAKQGIPGDILQYSFGIITFIPICKVFVLIKHLRGV